MIKKTVVALAVLVLALVASGCTTLAATPTGNSCTQVKDGPTKFGNLGCFYFMSNGTSVPCHVSVFHRQYCQNTKGEFYDYADGRTFSCQTQSCTGIGGVTSAPVNCARKFTYDDLANDGQAWQAINQQADQNTTRGTITINFSSTSATTVSESASINISANAYALLDVIFVSVHAQINASVAKTVSTVVGNEVNVTIPPGQTAHGIYGVSVQVTKGHLYQSNTCGSTKVNYGDVRTYVPVASGWCVWLSGQTPCRVVSH